ncbi:MAG TPA: hypothetical protein VGD54_04160 [Steroidobacteraceae bacterium]
MVTPPWWLDLEDLIEAFDLSLCFAKLFVESGGQLPGLGRLCHHRQLILFSAKEISLSVS